jgi:hypothetical protein
MESFKSKNYERAALALLKCVDMLDVHFLISLAREEYPKGHKQILEDCGIRKFGLLLSLYKKIIQMQ